jgi:hypothetical protein
VERDPIDPGEYNQRALIEEHRVTLMNIYHALPPAATPEYWQALEGEDIPLEVLVRCYRDAQAHGDSQGRNRIMDTITRRTREVNEQWANKVLKHLYVLHDERSALACDLSADLYVGIIRALFDEKRQFWEEDFWQSLYFERKHVYKSFMVREGWWRGSHAKSGERIPRKLITRLHQSHFSRQEDDNYASELQLAIESNDLFQQVLALPHHLNVVILLTFWEGRTEKDIAALLGITDRTVRNRKYAAFRMLREKLRLHGAVADDE